MSLLEDFIVVDKKFYQIASDEVGKGIIDQALWAKVTAEFPEPDASVQKAMYIKLRAQECAAESNKGNIQRCMPKTAQQWGIYLVVSFIIAAIVDTPFESYIHPRTADYVGFGTFFVLIAIPFFVKAICSRG
jgi:hypothetical protein